MSVERDQVPRPWPFPSTDARCVAEPEPEESDSPYCECNAIPTIEEDDWNQCMSCGKPLK
jgi:hypothetical protein